MSIPGFGGGRLDTRFRRMKFERLDDDAEAGSGECCVVSLRKPLFVHLSGEGVRDGRRGSRA
jgi:hypothetical protein